MNQVCILPKHERAALLRETAGRLGVSPLIAEKDLWVCWVLRRLFSLEDMPTFLLKGGTSLSKVHKLIERFSEDIDIVVCRADLGFGGDQDPRSRPSRKQQQRAVAAVEAASREFIRSQLLPLLRDDFQTILTADAWEVGIPSAVADQQTLLFSYPLALDDSEYAGAYNAHSVRIEFGARGEIEPAATGRAMPYAADFFPDFFSDPIAQILTLAAERTFWEKATFLHQQNHRTTAPSGGQWREKSRHCYDIVMMARGGVADVALDDMSLLAEVAEHKRVMFECTWADYEEAARGNVKLVPRGEFAEALASDYPRFRDEMIFGEAPTWGKILRELDGLEERIAAR